MSCPHIKSEVKTEEEDLISKSGGFLCPACGEQLFYEKYFIEHVRERHYKPDLQVLEKDEKQSLFSEFTGDSVHENGYVTEQESGCCVQNRSDVVKSEVKTEQIEINGESGGFLCSVCGEKILEEDNFIEHIKNHVENSGKRKIPKCDEFQSDNDNISVGSRIRNRSDSGCIPLENCDPEEKIRATLQYNVTIQSGEKSFKCPDCSYATVRKSNLKQHMKTHSGEKPYKCPDCLYAAARKSNLKVHLKTHSGDKPFKCPECLFATANKSYLKVHIMSIHLGEKPFNCPDCSYATAYQSCLKVHIKTHLGEKSFKCPNCLFATANKSYLKVHMKTHSGEKPYKCPDCLYAAVRKSHLKEHMETHSREKPFKCPNCSYAAVRKSKLLRHQKMHAN